VTERIRLACGCEIIRHEGIAATERVYCAQHGEAETKFLTDERLVAPHDGGCWYCHKADENLVFSIEWDAYVHLACVREALERDPQDDEAWVFARELGIAASGQDRQGGDGRVVRPHE